MRRLTAPPFRRLAAPERDIQMRNPGPSGRAKGDVMTPQEQGMTDATSQEVSHEASQRSGIQGAVRRYLDGLNALDPDLAVSAYAAHAIIRYPGQPPMGVDAFRAYLEQVRLALAGLQSRRGSSSRPSTAWRRAGRSRRRRRPAAQSHARASTAG
jgi:antitoxin component HigA of HigAB toxin-antitoxin module